MFLDIVKNLDSMEKIYTDTEGQHIKLHTGSNQTLGSIKLESFVSFYTKMVFQIIIILWSSESEVQSSHSVH